jgi:hypothetical protein
LIKPLRVRIVSQDTRSIDDSLIGSYENLSYYPLVLDV